MTQPSRKLALSVAAALSIGSVAAVGGIGKAQSQTGALTFHFVATGNGGFESSGRFGDGSVVGFRDRLQADDGRTGRDLGVCTITNLKLKESYCHAVAAFGKDRIYFDFVQREADKVKTAAVVGGTGTYAGVRGSATVLERGRRTDITVSLLG